MTIVGLDSCRLCGYLAIEWGLRSLQFAVVAGTSIPFTPLSPSASSRQVSITDRASEALVENFLPEKLQIFHGLCKLPIWIASRL